MVTDVNYYIINFQDVQEKYPAYNWIKLFKLKSRLKFVMTLIIYILRGFGECQQYYTPFILLAEKVDWYFSSTLYTIDRLNLFFSTYLNRSQWPNFRHLTEILQYKSDIFKVNMQLGTLAWFGIIHVALFYILRHISTSLFVFEFVVTASNTCQCKRGKFGMNNFELTNLF